MGLLLRVLVVLGGVVGLVGLAMLVTFRTGFRPGLTAVRHTAKHVFNPIQLRTAGEPGAYASVVEHVGRRSGTAYRTPVVVVEVDDDRFGVVLPYGPDADWVRNVVAAGGATVVHEGARVTVDDPRVQPLAELAHAFPDDPGARLFGVDTALTLRRVDATAVVDAAG